MKNIYVFLIVISAVAVFGCSSVSALSESIDFKDDNGIIVEEMPEVEQNQPIENVPDPLELPVTTGSQEVIISELTQIRLALQLLVYCAFPVCISFIVITRLIKWFSNHFT